MRFAQHKRLFNPIALARLTVLSCSLGVLFGPSSAPRALAKPTVTESLDDSPTLGLDGKMVYLTIDSVTQSHGLVASNSDIPPTTYPSKNWTRILPPLYQVITVYQNRVFVKTKGDFDAPYTELLLKRGGNKVSVEKEAPTHYTELQDIDGQLLIGKTYLCRTLVPSVGGGAAYETNLYSCDFAHGQGGVPRTLNNVFGDVEKLSDSTLLVNFVDSDGNRLAGFTDYEGNLIAPLAPNLTAFTVSPPDNTVKIVRAVPLDAKNKYWMPVRPDGTTPLELLPIKGYLLSSEGAVANGFLPYWLKEYQSDSGPSFGWAAPDLSEETGPKWKSIDWVRKGFPLQKKYPGALLDADLLVGQLLDGQWMGYDLATVAAANGDKLQVFKPLLQTPLPTQDALYTAVTPIFTQRGDDRMAQIDQAQVEYASWETEMKEYRGCAPGDDLHSDACEALGSYKDAMRENDQSRAYEVARNIGGDLFIEHLIYVSEHHIYSVEPERFLSLASSAHSPDVAAHAKKRYNDILENRKMIAQIAADNAKRSAQESRQVAARQNPVYQSSWATPSWLSPGPGPTLAEHQQTLDNYIRDYKSWVNCVSMYEPKSVF